MDDQSACTSTNVVDGMPSFDGTSDQGSLLSRSTLGKCSLLHSQQCALDDWADTLQCVRVVADWTTSPAGQAALSVSAVQGWADLGVSKPTTQVSSRSWTPLSFGLPVKPVRLLLFTQAILKSSGASCSLSTAVGYGSDCGVSASLGDVCWLIDINSTTVVCYRT